MAIHIRRATEQDYEVYCDLFFETNELHRLALPDIFQQPGERIIEQGYFLNLLEDERVAIFFAESEGQAAGFVYILIREALLTRCWCRAAMPWWIPWRYARPSNERESAGR